MDAEPTVGDPNNPLLFQLQLGREALDEALISRGIVPCQLHRDLTIGKLKDCSWRFIEEAVDELGGELEKQN